jgi:hypothetical protein
MDEIPKWVKLACERWGSQKRRVWSGGEWYIDREGLKQRHVDGYAQCFLGRLQDEFRSAGFVQRWREVFSGDALAVQRALPGISECPYLVLHLRYVFDVDFGLTAAQKAELIGVTTRTYWHGLRDAETWVHARLTAEHNTEASEVLDPPQRISPSLLQSEVKRATTPANTHRVGDLCLAALARSTLTLERRRR